MCDSDSGSLMRLKFLRDIGRDVYVRVLEVDHQIKEDNTNQEIDVEKNMAREREIFLRAVLQLLNQKESTRPGILGNNTVHKNSKVINEDEDMYDVIRLGLLRKCSRSGKFSALTAGNMSQWKLKYVELRHGALCYNDYHGAELSNLQDVKLYEQVHNRRYIHLSIDSCICRVVQSDRPEGSRIFEIAMVGGPRRFWMANTSEECYEWVRAIHTAMVGSDFGKIRGIDLNDHAAVLHSSLIADGGDLPPPLSINDEIPFRRPVSNKNDCLWLSMDGAAAPYAEDMSLFMHLHNSFVDAPDEETYRKLLNGLNKEHVKITIPVLFIKVWKDLQRDVIIVNGDRISGELGAEAMVGALVRHISNKAEQIRLYQQKLVVQQASLPLDEQLEHVQIINSEFSLSEALIVECARDLIVLCNRTQSGGDTYFCVEALLCGDRNESRAILTPFSAEADPLVFMIDAVLVSKNHEWPFSTALTSIPSFPLHSETKQPEPSNELDMMDAVEKDGSMDGSRLIETNSALATSPGLAKNFDEGREDVGYTVDDVDAVLSSRKLRSMSHDEGRLSLKEKHLPQLKQPHKSMKFIHENGVFEDSGFSRPQMSRVDKNKTGVLPSGNSLHFAARNSPYSSDSSSDTETSLEGSAKRPKTPRRRRKPQLDLRNELAMDGFQFNYFARPLSPMRPTQFSHVASSGSFKEEKQLIDHDNDPNNFSVSKNTSRGDSVRTHSYHSSSLRQSQHISSEILHPTHSSKIKTEDESLLSTKQELSNSYYSSSMDVDASGETALSVVTRPLNAIPLVVGPKDEESVISELTFDTFMRSSNNRSGGHSDKVIGAARSTLEEQRSASEDEARDLSIIAELGPSTSNNLRNGREHKSIFKQLGRTLKPFRMSNVTESLEGIGSPFRGMRPRGSLAKHSLDNQASSSAPKSKNLLSSFMTLGQSSEGESNHGHHPIRARRHTDTSQDLLKLVSQVQGPNATSNGVVPNTAAESSNLKPRVPVAVSGRSALMTSNGNPLERSVANDHFPPDNSSFTICIRVRVLATSRYKVCTNNPCGVEDLDTWATVRGTFSQSFLVGANGGQHLGMADRLVSIEVEDYGTPGDGRASKEFSVSSSSLKEFPDESTSTV
eukprot:scaffold10764_cov159-Ochromonas_danica.AAC.24